MKQFADSWFWRAVALANTIALICIAIKIPGALVPEANAGITKAESQKHYPINRLEFAQMFLNTHPATHVLTPYLTSEFVVREEGVELIAVYDKKLLDEKKVKNDYLDERITNAIQVMRYIGFKNFQKSDITVKIKKF